MKCRTCGNRRPDFYNDQELERLAHALSVGSDEPVSADDVEDFWAYAQKALNRYVLIVLVLESKVLPRRDPDKAHDYLWSVWKAHKATISK
jgi:hypothetical protein